MQTITITLCECAENHVGMEKIGKVANTGFSLDDLILAREWFESKGAKCQLVDLNYPVENLGIIPNDEGYILVVRNGVDYLVNKDELFDELKNLQWDTKAYMYGRVVNKKARHNLCFGPNSQNPDYSVGKGRIVPFTKVPLLNKIRKDLPKIIGNAGKNLVAEGNHYYNVEKCGIGFHGDSERRKVVGVRLGATIPLVYQWFYQLKPVGERIKLKIKHGDIYFMSEKATGFDWRRKTIYTLRHAAGAKKYYE